MAADPRAKFAKLITALDALDADYAEKRQALMAEIHAIINGDEGVGAKLARLKAHWCSVWTETHHEKCDFDHRKDTGFLKTKLLAGFTEDEIACKMQSYVTSTDPYYVKARHPFGLFRTNFNSWRGVASARDDAAQGIQSLREMRGV